MTVSIRNIQRDSKDETYIQTLVTRGISSYQDKKSS